MSYTYIGKGTAIHKPSTTPDVDHVTFAMPVGIQERDIILLIYVGLSTSGMAGMAWHQASDDPAIINYNREFPKVYPTPSQLGSAVHVHWFRWVTEYNTDIELWAPSTGWISEFIGCAVAFRQDANRHSIHGLDPNWFGASAPVGFGSAQWNASTMSGDQVFTLSNFLVGHDECLLMTAALHNTPAFLGGSDTEPVPVISPTPDGSDSIFGGDGSGMWGLLWAWWDYTAGGTPLVGWPVEYDYSTEGGYSSEASSWEMCAPSAEVPCEHYVT